MRENSQDCASIPNSETPTATPRAEKPDLQTPHEPPGCVDDPGCKQRAARYPLAYWLSHEKRHRAELRERRLQRQRDARATVPNGGRP